ncbi:ubiquitin domain-containing protein/PI3_PI4_kinase domain-containing protein [Cephalotus follicularis]|uniref:1-phosphatidylinositol 4-kinase n=1 Tax=Cephalotus follicularis TaxID=3775 RepID=A0A1Q3CCS7_CEPFO|nr:ubiquitin domain-containing protein/PI3_PI4_kinase domain-containing protein [Cephalotus follicularis]
MSSAGVAISPVRTEPMMSPSFLGPQLSQSLDETILIYLNVSGSMIPMRVLESDSIVSVKLRIQNCQGFVVSNQKLVCGGRELSRSNSLIRDYGVTDGNVMHVVVRLSDLQVIKVRTSSGKQFTFQVERGRHVGYVKQQIAKREREFDDVAEQEVVCDGERLEDQWLIDDICKHNDAVIHLLVRKTAKVRPKHVAKDFELSIAAPPLTYRKDYDGENDSKQYDACEENDERGYQVDRKIVPRKPPDRDFWLESIASNSNIELPSVILDIVNSTFEGLDSGNDPIRSMEGTGGAYFMQDSLGKKFVSVFKPIDEEPMAVNNPQGLPLSVDGEGLKKGTRVGEGAFREVAAYLLDHPLNGKHTFNGDEKGFAGVPPTTMIKCLHRGFNHPENITVKIGSLQMFMENNGSCEDIGPGALPVKEVHKISVLDMRLANADRHAGNILLSKGRDGHTVLIPIDHGYCLPESFEDCTFDWLYWPQAHQPYSIEIIDYIKSLDAEEDITLLKLHGWNMPLECARTLRISTMLLKKGVERGLTPFAIGSIMCRENLNNDSVIEEIVQEAWDSVLPGTSEGLFIETVSYILDRHLDEIAASPIS